MAICLDGGSAGLIADGIYVRCKRVLVRRQVFQIVVANSMSAGDRVPPKWRTYAMADVLWIDLLIRQ